MPQVIKNQHDFVEAALVTAKKCHYLLETNRRNGLRQIDFGYKKLHEGHLREMYPDILSPTVHIPSLIEKIAPGRPCTHKPMRKIIDSLALEK